MKAHLNECGVYVNNILTEVEIDATHSITIRVANCDDVHKRLDVIRDWDWLTPHGQPKREFNNPKQIIPQWQKDMARWMNRREIYNTTNFINYEPRKGFKCINYYKTINYERI